MTSTAGTSPSNTATDVVLAPASALTGSGNLALVYAAFEGAGVYKSFRLPRGTGLIVRLDVFNVFNQVRWWIPGNDINSPTTFAIVNQTAYGATNSGGTAPTSLTPPRTFQLGFRFTY